LHVSAYALLEGDQRKAALAILEQARREGVPISMDVPSGVARALGPQLVPAFDGVTVLTVGRRSLDPIGRDAAALAARCEVVAVTDGDRSVEIRRAGDVFRLTPPSVPVEDTTGAGDSFIAGLVASHSWGLDTPVAAVLAAALGAAAVQVPGAGRSLAGSPAAEVRAATDRWPDAEPAGQEAARRYVPSAAAPSRVRRSARGTRPLRGGPWRGGTHTASRPAMLRSVSIASAGSSVNGAGWDPGTPVRTFFVVRASP